MAEGKGRRNGNGRGNGKRRIWEFQPFTICRLLGLSFDEKDLRKIFKDLKLSHDNQFSVAFEMHQQLAQICRTQNQHAKRVEKLLEKQFAPYKKEVGILDPQRIYESLEGEEGTENTLKNVPIAALIWFAVRNGDQDKELEGKIFAAVHMKELYALRVYDALSRKFPERNVASVLEELNAALESQEKLQRRCVRLEQKKEDLILEREAIKEAKSRFAHELEEQRRLNERLKRMIEETGGEAAYEDIEGRKKELAFLREELKRLNKENTELVKLSVSRVEDKVVASACSCNSNSSDMGNHFVEPRLNGMRVAYVGGVESLESSYKELAESFGCQFCYHCGHCERGKSAIASLIDGNDVIFCPVDINSHNACRLVKKVCKLRDKPCCFLRSSGLSALKKGLANLAAASYG
ncbi:MAG: DUF2325 domain-containing protein [Euryarchaeota archaeon]|nr:DUF2325 domain-containing protein [Euryarchaeota archaeon]